MYKNMIELVARLFFNLYELTALACLHLKFLKCSVDG